MVKTTLEDRKRLASASELHIALPWPKGVKTLRGLNKAMMTRYHMEFGGDGGEELFYNDDLRSLMGFEQGGFADPLDLVVWPNYFAGGTDYSGNWEYDEGFGESYFKKLLTDAAEILVVRRPGEAPRQFRPSPPGGLPYVPGRPVEFQPVGQPFLDRPDVHVRRHPRRRQ